MIRDVVIDVQNANAVSDDIRLVICGPCKQLLQQISILKNMKQFIYKDINCQVYQFIFQRGGGQRLQRGDFCYWKIQKSWMAVGQIFALGVLDGMGLGDKPQWGNGGCPHPTNDNPDCQTRPRKTRIWINNHFKKKMFEDNKNFY